MINLYPGPSQLFHSVRDHMRQAFKLRIPELPWGDPETADLIQQTSRRLRELLSVPSAFTIFFLPSGEIIRERLRHDLIDDASLHFVHDDNRKPPPETELITLTHTDINGMHVDPGIISHYAREYPNALVAVDASYGLPYASLPYEYIDAVFLDFHFGFGLPAGLAAWMVKGNCFQRHDSVRQTKGYTPSVFSLSSLQQNAALGAPRDINLLMIACLSGVLDDMLSRGINTIRKETEYKAAIMYHLLANHPLMSPAVPDKAAQSRTIITADCGSSYQLIAEALQRHAVVTGTGQGPHHEHHLVFANFPSHSREQFEKVTDILNEIG